MTASADRAAIETERMTKAGRGTVLTLARARADLMEIAEDPEENLNKAEGLTSQETKTRNQSRKTRLTSLKDPKRMARVPKR